MKLRIGLVAAGIPLSSTGPSISVRELAEKLSMLGHDVTLIASDLTTGGGPAGRMVKIDPCVELRLFPAISNLERRFYRCKAMKQWLEGQVARFDVVDIQGVWSFVAVDAAAACTRAQVPYVLTPHGQMTRWDWRKSHRRKLVFFWLRLRRAWRGAAAIRFLSEREADNSAVEAPSRTVIIPNWVDPTEPCANPEAGELRRKLAIAQGVPVILFLGRITEQKGVREIVAAFDGLWCVRPDSVLVLVGPREEAYGAQLEKVISQLHCRQSIRLLGPIYDHRRFQLFSVASAFITLSKSEGLPVAVLEAMASGLPVVVTKEANLPEIAQYGAGAIVGEDPQAVATTLAAMIADPIQLRAMGERARKLVAERFSPAVVLPHLLALYSELASAERRARLTAPLVSRSRSALKK